MDGRRATLVFLPVFFASGFAALAYQIVWQRLLAFFSGADVFSVTLIVSAFMAGLGLGSLAGGHLADRLSPGGRFRAFAVAEAATAAFALVSVPLLYDVLYRHLAEKSLPLFVVGLLLFAVLLWPTFLMGLSLPLLARALTEDAALSARRIGGLYGWNTLGAATGALVTVFVVVRLRGFEGAVAVGAALNFACAATALMALRWLRPAATDPPVTTRVPEEAAPSTRRESGIPFAWWLLLYALSGFVALSLEILWFRLLGVIVKSNSFTFAWLLTLFLSGVGLGALLARSAAARSSRPGQAFLVLQMLVAGYAGLSVAVLTHGIEAWSSLAALSRYLGEYDAIELDAAVRSLFRFLARGGDVAPFARDLADQLVLLYGLVPAVLIGIPTLLMGASFPFLQRAVHADVDRLGRRVGWLQAANIAGATLGASVTGLVLLQVLGTAGTLRLIVGLGAVFALAAVKGAASRSRRTRALFASAAVLLVLAPLFTPSSDRLWARLHGSEPGKVILDEDGSGLSLLKEGVEDGRPHVGVFVNGLGQSWLPYGGYHTILGALPVLLHPSPGAVAVIGLGSADTLFGIAGRPETRTIECIEIVAPQKRTLEILARRRVFPGLEQILTDGRVRITTGDGRAFLARSARRYDVIEADALRPVSAWAGNVYSLEYFALLRSRLRPGGYAVTWCPTTRVRDTVLRSFPHVLEVGTTLIGSDAPIVWDPAALVARVREPFAKAHYRRGGVDGEALVAEMVAAAVRSYGPDLDRSAIEDVNTDLFPKDEYLASSRMLPSSVD